MAMVAQEQEVLEQIFKQPLHFVFNLLEQDILSFGLYKDDKATITSATRLLLDDNHLNDVLIINN